jgi:uncharacterized protein (UPF0332 family)
MFFAARAALSARSVVPRTHAGVVTEFGRVFVRSGLVDRSELAALSRALNSRLLAEYDEDLTFSPDQAEDIRAAAVQFVGVVRALMAERLSE